MEIREITNQTELDAFIGSQDKSQFLQSWLWGEFSRALPNTILRLGVFDNGRLVGSAQIIEHALPLGKKYWYVPRGPVVEARLSVQEYQTAWQALVEELVSRAERQSIMFIKLEPPLETMSKHMFDSLMQGWRLQPVHFVQPQDSWYLTLDRSADELLGAMHPKTRYNIRLAEKKGVQVHIGGDVHDFDAFWRLMETTARRDHFRQHTKAYYKELCRRLCHTDFMKMFLAEYNGQIIAANLVAFFGDTVTYVHGASADEYREVMAPHLLQWRQIQEAQQRRFRYYDFWGVLAEEKQTTTEAASHPWSGITRFKRGFGGAEIRYIGAYDLILDMVWYKLYKTVQRLRI